MTGLTDSLATFVARQDIVVPEKAAEIIRSGIIDSIGTMIAGRDEPVVKLVQAQLAERGGTAAEATVLLGPGKAYSADAALINATAAHALDYDDVAIGGHPSTVLMPVVLAEAERLGASGEAVMRAYLVGYEVWAELNAREPDALHLKGWHPTAVYGAIGAAAAAAHLAKLDAAACGQAMALAASMAAGLVANFGTMTKPFHAGRAAASGIEAARLAARGFTSSADAIEHHAGFLKAVSPENRADLTSPAKIGQELRILTTGLSIKRYPMCYSAHRTADAVLALTAQENLRPEDVAAVECTIGLPQASMLRNHAPVTGLEAKFSLEFAVASALVARRVGLQELTDEFVNKPEVREQYGKVKIHITEKQCPLEPAFAYADSITLHTTSGRQLHQEVRFPKGNAMAPLSLDELREKFVDCAAGAPVNGDKLFDRLCTLEKAGALAGGVAKLAA